MRSKALNSPLAFISSMRRMDWMRSCSENSLQPLRRRPLGFLCLMAFGWMGWLSYQTFILRIRNMLGLVRSCCVTYLRTVRMACLLLSKEGMRLRCQAGFQPSTDFSCMKKILIGFLVVLNYGLLSARHRLISVEFSKQFLLPVLVIKGLLLLLFEPAGRAESGLSLICRQEGSASSAEVVQDFRSEPHFISFRASLKALNASLMYRF